MKRPLLLFLSMVSLVPALRAADGPPAADVQVVYRQRAEKIVAALGLSDAAKAARVRDLVADQYQRVNRIQDPLAAQLKALKQSSDQAAAAQTAQSARAAAEPKLAELHASYLAKLGAELTPAQIDQVKDGMTYGVLPLTYRVYLEMLPNLTDEQKTQIMAWLVEAREHAMDAGTSEEKHAWFGKYKGRVNNFLAKAGIDMKPAEKEMLARQKASSTGK